MVSMELEGYGISTTPDVIVVSKEGLGSISFAPGHVATLRSILGIVSRLEGAPMYPSPLRATPFEVLFRVLDDVVEIEVKREDCDTGICLSFGEFDKFIGVVDDSFNIFQDEARLAPQRPRTSHRDVSGSGSALV